MSYVKGELRVAFPGEHKPYELEELPGAYLPHSCDEWVIGGAEEVRALIFDLQHALARMEAATAERLSE